MGTGCSKGVSVIIPKSSAKMAAERNLEIDQELQEEMLTTREIKVLLLGAGESGKSTIVKQLKIIHDDGYGEGERKMFKSVIYSNAVQSLFTIVKFMKEKDIKLHDKELAPALDDFYSFVDEKWTDGSGSPSLFQQMRVLWNDWGVQESFSRSGEYQLNDSAAYFLNSLERISEPDFIPNEDDILRTRSKTTGIVESKIVYKQGLTFRLIDVGGQRSERKKWIHCFDNVIAVIFIAALSDYDLKLVEDNETNRLLESLRLFSSICNNRWFYLATMILFLNKTDLFREKILSPKGKPLTVCFKDYDGDLHSVHEGMNFIQSKFESLKMDPDKELFAHFTCATDTSNIKVVFSVVADALTKANLVKCGLY